MQYLVEDKEADLLGPLCFTEPILHNRFHKLLCAGSRLRVCGVNTTLIHPVITLGFRPQMPHAANGSSAYAFILQSATVRFVDE